jgi:cobalt-zinc-cadmium efflux system membrane fusion protein
MKRTYFWAALAAVGLVVAVGVLNWRSTSLAPKAAPQTEPAEHADEHIKLTDEQVAAAQIKLAPVETAQLAEHFLAPGTIVPDADRIGRVAVRVLGAVTELRKRVGDPVEKDEVVAVLESRELSEVKSEYLAARLTNELQQTLAARYKTLWESRSYPENEYLKSRLTAQDARIRLDSARQKLLALGLNDAEIQGLPDLPIEELRKQSLRSPIKGRVAERRVDLGALVGREGQESELFVIVNLDTVWIDLAISPNDLSKVAENAEVNVIAGPDGPNGVAKIVFVSPLIDKDTRSAKVIASLNNAEAKWRPGMFVTAEIPLASRGAVLAVPKAALQTVGGAPMLFVREGQDFVARKVQLGHEDDTQQEIVAGVSAGEIIAVSNTFTLKAELGKSEAEH